MIYTANKSIFQANSFRRLCVLKPFNLRKYQNFVVMLLLDDDDNLYNAESYTIVHNGFKYQLDPLPAMQYSRVFAQYFRENSTKCVVNDNFSEPAFETYIYALQMNSVAASPRALVDLLLISDAWDSKLLIVQIEELINTRANPNEIIGLYISLLGTQFNHQRLEDIIVSNLPRYIECPKFATLSFETIERMIAAYPGKLTANQIVRLCYNASAFCGLESIGFIKRNSFDNMTRDEIIEIADQFEKCPFPQLRDFLIAMSHLIHQLLGPINENEKFDQTWLNADVGEGEDAFAFYKLVIDESRPKKKKENLRTSTRTFTRSVSHARGSTALNSQTSTAAIDEDVPPPNYEEPKNPTQIAFLKAAAERGHAEAQYIWGKWLYEHRSSEQTEDEALEFLIQAAGKNIDKAKELLSKEFTLDKLNLIYHNDIYQVLGLQNLLLNLTEENFDSSKLAIRELSFDDEDEAKTMILAQNILKAVQIRQRNQLLYAKLVKYIHDSGCTILKQFVFSTIMSSLYTPDPMHQQLVYIAFLRVCSNCGTLTNEEFVVPLIDFLRSSNMYLKSALLVFYFFADLVMEVSEEIFAYLKMKLFNYRSKNGMGNMDKFLHEFKDNFNQLMNDDAKDFKEDRNLPLVRDQLTTALVNDDLKMIRKLTFDPNTPIQSYFVDLTTGEDEGTYGTEELLPIQMAATQGSQACFLYLLRRMPDFSFRNDPISTTCCCCGQNKFILGFITGLSNKRREETFRMAAKWNNMYLMILLLQGNIDINCKDDYGSTALHFATRNGNPSIVQFLASAKGIDINAMDNNGVTPLHYAVFLSKLDIVKILCQVEGIDVNIRDKHGSSPLHYAVWNNDIHLVEYLVSLENIDVNITAKVDRTPLHEAAKCGFLEIVRILAERTDIVLNAEDKNGRTPLKLAMKRHQDEVAQYLKTLAKIKKTSSTSSSSGANDDVGSIDPGDLRRD